MIRRGRRLDVPFTRKAHITLAEQAYHEFRKGFHITPARAYHVCGASLRHIVGDGAFDVPNALNGIFLLIAFPFEGKVARHATDEVERNERL